MPNMVDERFECLAAIFRLAGRWEYSFIENDYQKEVADKFKKFTEHPAVKYVKTDLPDYIGYDAVFSFSVHIEKNDCKFVFIVYCLLWGNGGSLIHEFCHSFGNPLAGKWYNENPEFKKWCDDSINLEKQPYYNNGRVMANEYVTRAYEILYKAQHEGNLEEALAKEKNQGFENGFPYIEQVYKMVLELEK